MSIHQRIEADLKAALKTGNREKAGVLRFLIAAIKNHQIEIKAKDKEFLDDDEIIAVLNRQIKQRKDSVSEYQKGNRPDLAQKEEKELAMLKNYAPAQMDEGEVREIVRSAMKKLGLSEKADFGKLMGALMKDLRGKADGSLIKKIVEDELGHEN